MVVWKHLQHWWEGKSLIRKEFPKASSGDLNRGRTNREVQTVNWEADKKGAVETGVKRGLKKAHKPRIRGKKGAQTVN